MNPSQREEKEPIREFIATHFNKAVVVLGLLTGTLIAQTSGEVNEQIQTILNQLD